MVTAILGWEEEKEPEVGLFAEELPFDFFIGPNIPRSSGNGYFREPRLESN